LAGVVDCNQPVDASVQVQDLGEACGVPYVVAAARLASEGSCFSLPNKCADCSVVIAVDCISEDVAVVWFGWAISAVHQARQGGDVCWSV